MLSTRTVPHVSRLTQATFYRLEVLGAAGEWRMLPGLHATAGSARLAAKQLDSTATTAVDLLANVASLIKAVTVGSSVDGASPRSGSGLAGFPAPAEPTATGGKGS